ncbi:universal stress A family [Fusarium heterosporum]|uniref:Universal stress A family n=1 Tax=Fusarium heterosporum TaxID=42747 RepID=A0A8H5X0Z4_FUSHE|nr:universal stress A family [Fusarium heterosporum]
MATLTKTSPDRFQKHVAFDNVPTGEPTKNNAISFTLNVRHKGYQARRRSRCFMVGVDEHAYSDYALQWLLEELVDDGDEVVCVRVVEKELRSDKQYRDDAQAVMRGILDRNGNNRAINIVLEYAVGKLHTTFQVLIQMYQPAMLIVGTRGRTLGGLQGLVNTRNSFSKYCLQYSPVPVIVVRPTEKRIKKKAKRANDSGRQTYVSMLAATAGKHEADSEASSTYELEVHNSPDEEAHQVARALGLPAAFDPTIKPLNHNARNTKAPAPTSTSTVNENAESQPAVRDDGSAATESDDDDDDDDSGEFEVVSGQQALDQQKIEQLHKMEVGEAAALKMKMDDELEEDDDTPNKYTNSQGNEDIGSMLAPSYQEEPVQVCAMIREEVELQQMKTHECYAHRLDEEFGSLESVQLDNTSQQTICSTHPEDMNEEDKVSTNLKGKDEYRPANKSPDTSMGSSALPVPTPALELPAVMEPSIGHRLSQLQDPTLRSHSPRPQEQESTLITNSNNEGNVGNRAGGNRSHQATEPRNKPVTLTSSQEGPLIRYELLPEAFKRLYLRDTGTLQGNECNDLSQRRYEGLKGLNSTQSNSAITFSYDTISREDMLRRAADAD